MSQNRNRNPLAALAVVLGLFAGPAAAWQDNPVWVDDSPRAWELFRRAEDQRDGNSAEAVRIFQELLDEYAHKLVPASETTPDHLTSTRALVTRRLRDDPELLERYRNIATAEATRQLEAGDLERLARTRSLTRPGLVALLRLGQAAIEDARFEVGLARLREATVHPDLTGDDAAHCRYMIAMAAHFLGDARRGAAARQALEELGPVGAEFGRRLDALTASTVRPNLRRGVSSMDPTETSDLTDLVAEEIWSVPLKDSLLSRYFSNPAGPDSTDHPSREQRRRAADLQTAAATVSGSTVFINQGDTILALDRFTGRERWSFAARHRMASLDRDTDQTLDLNMISLAGDALITLTGHATADGGATDGEVLCLDAFTGERRWSRSLDRIGDLDEHDGLFPHGRPIISEGGVFVLARKVSKQLLTSCYVAALDLETGDLRWMHHIASSGGLRRSARGLSTLTLRDGDLYVATPVGAITRLRADTGEAVWLRSFNVPISPRFQDQTGRPWELSGPVITDDEVVAIQPGQRRVVFLDRETGQQLRSDAADTRDGWNSPRYLLANDHSIYAIGREIRAFRLEMPSRPAWFLPALPRATEANPDPVRGFIEIRGRVQLANGALIVPTLEGVLVVDDETGVITHRLPVGTVGTPVATDAQLLLAGSDRLDAYMSFNRAEEMLRGRIANNPRDPEPALSLLRLGARSRRLGLALEAAELAREAIDSDVRSTTSSRSRQELVELLLELDASSVATSRDQGEALHGLIGTIAMLPEQRVEHRLAYGRWLEAHDLARAVEQYQAVLSEIDLASVARAEAGIIRGAGRWATDRLTDLLAEHGSMIYAPQADFAAMRLEQITTRSPGNSTRLLALEAEYPPADAAIDAALRAAELQLQRGEHRAAAAALVGAFLRSPRPEAARRLLGRFVAMCEDFGWREPALAALDEAAKTAPGVMLDSPRGPQDVRVWREAFTSASGDDRPPRLGKRFDTAEVRFGRLVPTYPDGPVNLQPDTALLYDGLEMRRIDAPDLSTRWTWPLEDPAPQVLHRRDDGLLIWFGSDLDHPRAVMLDDQRGTVRWTSPPLSRYLGDPVRDLIRERGVLEQMPGGEPFNPKEALPLVSHDRLFIVLRSGGVIAFDLDDATEPMWVTNQTLDQVHHARATEFGIVLAGMHRRLDAGAGQNPLVPRVQVLDPATGRSMHTIRPWGRSGIKWMCATPLGPVVYGNADAIEAIDPDSGAKLWTNINYTVADARNGWAAGDRIFIEDRETELRAIAVADGAVTPSFPVPGHGDWNPAELQDLSVIGEDVYVRYRQRLVQYDKRGTVIGADAITGNRDYAWMLPVEGGLMLISRYKTEQAIIPDQSGRRTQHTYRIYDLSRNCRDRGEMELHPISQRFFEAAAIDGWLLLSTQTDTLAIPMDG